MRTKTLFIAAAALAAGIATSMAQSNVYSVNIVGYVNQPVAAATQTLLANPLDNGTNTLVSLDTGLPNKTIVQIWNGTGFTASSKVSGAWGNNLSIPPGTGFFVKAPSAATLTFVGSSVTSNNYALPGGVQTLAGSVIPFSGTLTDAGPNSLNLGASLPNKSIIQIWNGTGFTASTKVSGAWGINFSMAVAQGFFVKPAAASTWTQNLQ